MRETVPGHEPAAMTVRFWGVRGSIPCPRTTTMVYGGNTACVEVRCGDRLIILDAGSGIQGLGWMLAATGEPLDLDILLSHCHIDHVIGLPFFQPAFQSSTALRLWAGHLSPDERLADMLAQLMVPPLLPITPSTFRAQIAYHDFQASDRLDLGRGVSVATAPLNHPGGATGYRIDHGGCSVAYVTDHEHTADGPTPALLDLVRDADLMIYDATYTPAEHAVREGWGHSTWEEAIRLADAAAVKTVALFHHDPNRDDTALALIVADAAARRPGTIAAREGLVLTFPLVARDHAAATVMTGVL